MVEETNFEGTIAYKCLKCGWTYAEISVAELCEDWCREHDTCNELITSRAIKMEKQ